MTNEVFSKIVLGTVQFGLDYGINSQGRPSETSIGDILNFAYQKGITELDTAEGYGAAPDILSRYFYQHGPRFAVMSKFVPSSKSESFTDIFSQSLKRLGVSTLEGYYFHRFSDFLDFEQFQNVKKLKKDGKLKRLAVSLYSDYDLEIAVSHPEIDQIQLPFNLLDHGRKKVELLEIAKKNNKLIYVRSVFLQGLFFIPPSELPPQLRPLANILIEIREVAEYYKMSIEELCMNYVYHKSYIDKLVIGVDSKRQLELNLSSVWAAYPKELEKRIDQIELADVSLLNPVNWK